MTIQILNEGEWVIAEVDHTSPEARAAFFDHARTIQVRGPILVDALEAITGLAAESGRPTNRWGADHWCSTRAGDVLIFRALAAVVSLPPAPLAISKPARARAGRCGGRADLAPIVHLARWIGARPGSPTPARPAQPMALPDDPEAHPRRAW